MQAFRSRQPARATPATARGACSRGLLPATAEHLETDLLLRDLAFVLGGDPSLVEDEDAGRQGEDLLEPERDQEDRAALVTLLDQAAVEIFDRADVEAARWLGGD